MGSLLYDIRFNARSLRRNISFSVLAILAMALGIGASTAIFSVVNSVLLRPLPYPEPDRLTQIFSTAADRGLNQTETSYQRFTAISEQSRSFESVGSYAGDIMNLTGPGDPAQLTVERFSFGVLEALRTRPAIGRNFALDEDRRGGLRAPCPAPMRSALTAEHSSSLWRWL